MFPNKDDWTNIQVYYQAFEQLSNAYLKGIDQSQVAKLDTKLSSSPLNNSGFDLEQCVAQVENEIIPQLALGRGPRCWSFVTGGATPVATMADWLVATFDQNVHKAGDSIASLVEKQAIEWLCELFEIPKTFKGVMPTGATGCNFLGACIARQFAGKQQGIDVAKQGVYQLSVEIFSTTPHASMVKSLGMAGLGQNNITLVKALDNSEKMDTNDLARRLKASSAKSKIVIASAGTVTTTDFDDLESVASLCHTYEAWLHVDAAFGLFERVVYGTNGKTAGIDKADSITVDCHKWLNVPYDCGVFLTRHLGLLQGSFDVPAPYLKNFGNEPDFMSLGIENSRRFRAFPVWLTLLAYGRDGVKSWVKSNIDLAKRLANWIEQNDQFELVHPCHMNVVLFRPNVAGLSKEAADEKTKAMLQEINLDGRLYLSPGLWQGKEIFRAALSNWQTSEKDIQIATEALLSVSELSA